MLAVSWSSSEYFTRRAIYIYVQGVALNIKRIVFITKWSVWGNFWVQSTLKQTYQPTTNCISFYSHSTFHHWLLHRANSCLLLSISKLSSSSHSIIFIAWWDFGVHNKILASLYVYLTQELAFCFRCLSIFCFLFSSGATSLWWLCRYL